MKARSIATLLTVTLFVPVQLLAQALADRIPDDAMLYVGWRGADNPGDAYNNSRLKAFLDASQIPQLVDQTLPKLLDKMAEKDRSAAEFRAVLGKIGPAFWRYPSALYVGTVDGLNAGSVPVPRGAILVQAGDDADRLKHEFQSLLDRVPPDAASPPVSIDSGSGIVAVMLGNATLDLSGKGQATLAHHKPFLDAMAQVGHDPVAAIYIDAEAVQETIGRAVALYGQQEGHHIWSTLQGDLGLSGLKRVAMTMGFDQRDWCAQTFIDAPAPRRGLLQWLESPPMSDATLKLVPQSATMMLAGHLDAAKWLDLARTVAGKFAPGGAGQVDSVLALGGVALGLNIENDLIRPLGDEWVLYASPTIGGNGPLGLVLINHPRDAAKLDASLRTLGRLANRAIDSGTPRSQPRANFVDADIAGLNVHYLDTPLVSPAWAMKDGNLYIAMFPQTAAAAASAPHDKSILDNENFVALRRALSPGAEKASEMSFFDLPRAAPEGYPYVLAVTRLLGFADMSGLPTPPAVLPPLDKLMPILSPAGDATWADDAGIHNKTLIPFPGAELLAGPEVLLMEGNGFILPTLAKLKAAAAAHNTPAQLAQPEQKQ
jgi:hypothetical protein